MGQALGSRRLFFFSPPLHSEGSVPVPAGILAGRGSLSIGVARDGSMVVHRDASPVVGETSGASHEFGAVKLTRVAAHARGLAVDDNGNLFVSAGGHLVELLPDGTLLRGSRFNGMPAQGIVRVSRSFSNAPKSFYYQSSELAGGRPRRRRPASADDEHATLRADGNRVGPPYRPSSFAITMRCTSFVPSPISSTFWSR